VRDGLAVAAEASVGNTDEHLGTGSPESPCPVSWDISCVDVPDKHFMFRGRLVPQPSVLWVLTRRGTWSDEGGEL
jgi:hypothetical protein